jgi:hypothetical protein
MRHFVSSEDVYAHIARCVDLFYSDYINNFRLFDASAVDKITIEVNEFMLAECIENALFDLDRWVNFHLSGTNKRPDHHKYAGFLSKWIAKGRPLCVTTNKSSFVGWEYPDSLYKINAIFSLTVFRSFLSVDIPSNLVKELVYRFHYRDDSGENLAFIAYCCEQLSNQNGAINKLVLESIEMENQK